MGQVGVVMETPVACLPTVGFLRGTGFCVGDLGAVYNKHFPHEDEHTLSPDPRVPLAFSWVLTAPGLRFLRRMQGNRWQSRRSDSEV